MNSDLLSTDGPLTRSRRKALDNTGMTPVAGDLGGATPNLLQETPMARELFTDKTNILDQARSFQSFQGKEFSPTNGWTAKDTRGDLFTFNPDADRELPVTPNLFLNVQKADIQHETPASSMCVHGPTPNNTPAAGCVLSMPAPTLLSQAVNELKGEGQENDNVTALIPQKHHDDAQDSDSEDLDAGTEDEKEISEINKQEELQHTEDIDPRISELLKELDEYVLGSPAEKKDQDAEPSQVFQHGTVSMSEAASGVAQVLALTPAAPDSGSLAAHPSSTVAEPSSALKSTPSQATAGLTLRPTAQEQAYSVVRDNETRHTSGEELPVSSGPYSQKNIAVAESSDDMVQQASPAPPSPAVMPMAAVPVINGADEQSPVQLQAAGREDDLPTPGFFQPGSFMAKAVSSPVTPEDASIKPLSFAKSAGSQFATPEVPISCGMTPMTTVEERQAQKHIPAWNRVCKVVEKQLPLVSKIVQGLWNMPSEQPAWTKTPFMLLHAVCIAKGWGLTVSPETEARIGSGCSIVATVNMLAPTVEGGRTFTATGHLEALLLAAAGVLEKLLKEHLIAGKDANAAMNAAPSTFKAGNVPAMVGSTLHFGSTAAHASSSTFASARAKFSSGLHSARPPVPMARSASGGMMVPTADVSTPLDGSPHLGIGVRAPPLPVGATPELIPVTSPAGSLLSARGSSKPVTPVYHPPMRTGTSSVRSKNKATIAAAAKPTGLKALQEQQKTLLRNMKKESEIMAELTKSVGKISIAAKSSAPLRGLPIPKGSCVKFDEDGQACEVEKRDQLRGMPPSHGKHTYFE